MIAPTEIRNKVEKLRSRKLRGYEIIREVCKLCAPYHKPGYLPISPEIVPNGRMPNGAVQEWIQQLRRDQQVAFIELDFLSEDALDALELILLERLEDDSRRVTG